MCCAPRRARRVLRPSPVPWSCTSSHTLCVAPFVARVMCHTRHPCCGRAPRRMRCVLHPLLCTPCIAPITWAVVMHLIARAVCCALRRPCRVLCPSPVSCVTPVTCPSPVLCCAPRHVHHVLWPSSCAPCVAALVMRTMCCGPHHARCVLWPLSRAPCVVALVVHAVCHGPCRTCRVLWPSLHVLCVVALVTRTVCCGPHHAHHVSQPSSCAPCVVALIVRPCV